MDGPNLQNEVDDLLRVPPIQPSQDVVTAAPRRLSFSSVEPAQVQLQLSQDVVPAALRRPSFSPFNPAQMQRASELARQFAAVANSTEGEAGLTAATQEAKRATVTEDPELVRYAFLLFVTQDPKGRQIKIKPLEKRVPEQVLSSTPSAVPLRGIAAPTDPEAALNWFREDPKANEHHEHWHFVYPWDGGLTGKTRDRQGELFLYMHEQMIARYNAERLAVGLGPVKPLPLSNDSNYSEQIPEKYNPDSHLREDDPRGSSQVVPFSGRPAGEKFGDLPDLTVAVLKQWGDNLLQAAQSGFFQDQARTPVSADLLGATVEASIDSVDQNIYGSHHNIGHGFLANINNPQNPVVVPGVMSLPRTAIRDPIFFRWHKHIDDISFLWQEQQPPNDFSDAPQVLIRKGLSGAARGNQSPDIILCFKDAVLSAGSNDSEAFWQGYGAKNFGGANWGKDFSSSKTTTRELQTAMRKRTITFMHPEGNNQIETISYLDPREFFYFLRVENQLAQVNDVTVRIFLAPTGAYAGIPEVAEDRRMWIEMDKFRYTLQPSQRAVIFRRAESSSVIRRPAIKKFKSIVVGGTQPDTDNDSGDVSCDCGWPYNLLLPRGTNAGMHFRLLVMITDWNEDRVPNDTTCGSMSYCGAQDRYPDSRGMGYPFDRPVPQGSSIAQIIAGQKNIATRDITIKLVGSVPG